MECTKTAGQQETNAALAALAASGNAFALGQALGDQSRTVALHVLEVVSGQ